MPERKTLLARCRRCKKHGHWIFRDGSKSAEFATVADGALIILKAVGAGDVDQSEVPDLLRRLDISDFPTASMNVVIAMPADADDSPLSAMGQRSTMVS